MIVQGAKHKNESKDCPANGQQANAKQPSNSLKEDSHFLSHHHNINNGFSEAIEILRKSGSLTRSHKDSNGCCRDNNIQMISQV